MSSLHPNVHQSQTIVLYPLYPFIPPVINASLSSLSLNNQDTLKIIYSLNINKAHRYDDISKIISKIYLRLLKICDSSIVRPLSIIFKNCLQSRPFPNKWRKSNVTIHKKGDKQLLPNYLPVSLLTICGKIFERIIFNPIFGYLEKYSLLCPNNLVFVHLTHAVTINCS